MFSHKVFNIVCFASIFEL